MLSLAVMLQAAFAIGGFYVKHESEPERKSLLSRPEFTLMRRVRDSVMFVLVNSVTILALVVAGILFWLFSTDPVQNYLHANVYPTLFQLTVGTTEYVIDALQAVHS